MAAVLLTVVANGPRAQTLDQAVNQQLQPGGAGPTACFELLDQGTASIDVLEGSLRELCLGVPAMPPVSASAGGGQVTPASAPGVIQRRLREARPDDGMPSDPPVGASADDAVWASASGVSVFFSGSFQSLNKEFTVFEDGYDSDIWRITAGADYQISTSLLAGLAFDYYRQDGSFNGGGDFDVDSYGFLAYLSWLPFQDAYVQVIGGWSRQSFERSRFTRFEYFDPNNAANFAFVEGILDGDYMANAFRAGALVGYDHPIQNLSLGPIDAIRVGPRAGLEWGRRDYGSYSERGRTTASSFDGATTNGVIPLGGDTGLELRFDDDEQTLLTSRLGVQAAAFIVTEQATIIPQVALDWRHEFENDQRAVDVSFVQDTRPKAFSYQTETPDRDWLELNVGLIVADLPGGIQAFGNYQTLFGHQRFDSHAGTIGARIPF